MQKPILREMIIENGGCVDSRVEPIAAPSTPADLGRGVYLTVVVTVVDVCLGVGVDGGVGFYA